MCPSAHVNNCQRIVFQLFYTAFLWVVDGPGMCPCTTGGPVLFTQANVMASGDVYQRLLAWPSFMCLQCLRFGYFWDHQAMHRAPHCYDWPTSFARVRHLDAAKLVMAREEFATIKCIDIECCFGTDLVCLTFCGCHLALKGLHRCFSAWWIQDDILVPAPLQKMIYHTCGDCFCANCEPSQMSVWITCNWLSGPSCISERGGSASW